MIANLRALLFRDWTVDFNRQIRNAFGCVQHTRVDDGAGGTGVDAERAGAALIEAGRVGLELEAGRDAGEKIRGPARD